MKTTSLNPREIAVWLVLVCAMMLFGFSVTFAQDGKKESKGKVTIKIQKDEDGKKTKIDTTITEDQLPALKEYLKDLEIDFDAGGEANFHFRHPGMSKKEREKLKEEMGRLGEEMMDLEKELKDIHIEIHGFDDGDPENFDFHMTIPPIPPHAPLLGGEHGFYFHDGDEDDSERDCKPGRGFSFQYGTFGDEVPDSLLNREHIIIRGKKGEEKPELEKEIIGKDGEKIFVFKRKLPKEESTKVNSTMTISKVKVYPNPGDGKISISFNSLLEGDVEIAITDAGGKEVFSKSLNNFSGEYFDQVDISKSGKGTYFLKITQGDDSLTKKILVE